jgi:hypothetical protein
MELCSLLMWFAPCFTQPSLAHFVSFITCLIADLGRATATTVYRTSAGDGHWTNYSRFLSVHRWSPRALSARLLELLIERCGLWLDDQGRQRFCLVLDETMVAKSSRRMFGVAWHRNARPGACEASHILGHYWIMLGLLVRVGRRTCCLPLAFRLYRQKKRCPPEQYRKPCQVALDLLESIEWPQRPEIVRTVLADAGFADKRLLRWCDQNQFVAVVRGRIDARVHDLCVRQRSSGRGRPPKYGEKICLRAWAADERNFAQAVHLYQEGRRLQLTSMVGLHYVSGLPMRFVILRSPNKTDMMIMSTDLSLTPREIAQLYADRFAIEMTFRELKQHFGLGHYQVRKPEAMLRHVHLSAVACALTQLLTLCPPEGGWGRVGPQLKATPWRGSDAVVSVRDIQLLLRWLSLRPTIYPHVAAQGRVRPISPSPSVAPPGDKTPRKNAEL